MKKMKRFLVALLSCLTAVACVAGISACKDEKPADDNTANNIPSFDIDVDMGGDPLVCAHDYSKVLGGIPATCTEAGSEDLMCTKCGEIYKKYVAALGHDWEDPSCTVASTCKVCETTKGAALEHNYADATCTANKTCKDCGAEVENTKLAHKWAVADCEADVACSVCNTVATSADLVNTAARKHVWVSAFGNLVEPGSHTTNVEAAADGYYYIPATCLAEGYKSFTFCKTCYDKWDADEDLAYELLKDENGNVADAVKAAYLFGENGIVSAKGFEIIPKAHVVETDFVTAATNGWAVEGTGDDAYFYYPASTTNCSINGIKNFKYCAYCTSASELPAFDGTKTVAEFKKALDDAEVVYGEIEEIAVTADSAHLTVKDGKDSLVAGVAATCTTDGYTTSYKCYREGCGHEVKRVVLPKTGHDVKLEETASTKATCTAKAYCAWCEESYGDLVAHSKKNLTAVKATCTEDGYTNKSWYCTVCQATEYVVDYAKGHNFVEVKATVATCVAPAYDAHYKCTACDMRAKGSVQNEVLVYSDHTEDISKFTTAGSVALNHTIKISDTESYTGSAAIIDFFKTKIEAELAAGKTCTTMGAKGVLSYTCANGCKTTLSVKPHDTINPTVFALNADGYPVVSNKVVEDVEKITNAVAATCDTNAVCAFCLEEIAGTKLGHKFAKEAHKPAVAATCTEDGSRAYYLCENASCNVISYDGKNAATVSDKGNIVALTTDNVVDYNVITALGHVFADVALKLPTHEAGYYAHKACVICDAIHEDYDADYNGELDAEFVLDAIADCKSTADDSCAAEVVCDCAYATKWVDANKNGKIDDGELSNYVGCGKTYPNTDAANGKHVWKDGKCQLCFKVCSHSYTDDLDKDCNVCGKKRD